MYGGEDVLGGVLAFSFFLQRRQLRLVQLLAFEISTKPLRASRQMFGMEAGRGHSMRPRPELRGRERADGVMDILADMFAGTEEMSDHRVYSGDYATHPW